MMNDIPRLGIEIWNQLFHSVHRHPLGSQWIIIVKIVKSLRILHVHFQDARNPFPVFHLFFSHPLETPDGKGFTHSPTIEIIRVEILNKLPGLGWVVIFSHVFVIRLSVSL